MPYLPPLEKDDFTNELPSILPNQDLGGFSPETLENELANRGQKILTAAEAATEIIRRRRR